MNCAVCKQTGIHRLCGEILCWVCFRLKSSVRQEMARDRAAYSWTDED